MEPGHYMRFIRKKLGMTQTQFASLILPERNPKKAQISISRYERGHTMYSADILIKLQSIELNMHEKHKEGKENIEA
jgi:transcriptional regulator with XRE-family HTH domain